MTFSELLWQGHTIDGNYETGETEQGVRLRQEQDEDLISTS